MSAPHIVNREWDELDESFAAKLRAVIEQANLESRKPGGTPKFPGFGRWELFEGYRSQERQNWLYAQGRRKDRPGPIVTWRKKSNHTSRRAADVVWKDFAGNWRWDGDEGLWAILGHCARAHGLKWGGDWKMRDLPHIEAP